ncbi:MAG: hypothetical protein CM15mP32_2740 [Flavobacteriaceae bacterium]|nr:MAG: hypothetical protein CM15mP32_2740 [Flavobacteriaceae bacterium]
MGGNYLLNIGPMSDGTVVPYERDVLNGLGNGFRNTKKHFTILRLILLKIKLGL